MIAGFLGGEIVGDPNATVTMLAKIEEGAPGALSFLSNPKYEHYVYDSDSSIIIVNKDFTPTQAVKATMIKVDDAYSCFAKLLELYVANKPQKKGIAKSALFGEGTTYGEGCYFGDYAVVGNNVKIGSNCKIYPHVFIDDGVTIGDNTTIYSGVKIYEGCRIGNGVIIHSGAVIGADGFGFAPNAEGVYEKIPQIGIVILEDNVDIGANTCVDCATMGATIVKKGVKLDNLIQIAHNVVVGENTVAAAQTGIAGSTKVGASCMMGGQVGLVGHLTIGDRVHIGSKSGVLNNVKEGSMIMGFPSLPSSNYKRSFAIFKQLPELANIIYRLDKESKKG